MGDRNRRYTLLLEEDLVAFVDARDPEAFAVLYDRHSVPAYFLAYRMMGDRRPADDLVRDAFLEIWRSASRHRAERGSVRIWILSIVHRRGIDKLRSTASCRTRGRIETETPTHRPSEAFGKTWRDSQRERVREALKLLPAEQLKVLELAYFSGLTHAEVAEILDLSPGTVKGLMRLGMKKVKELFDAQG